MTKHTEIYTTLKTSKLMHDALRMETGAVYDDDVLVLKTTLGYTTLGCEGPGGEPTWYDSDEAGAITPAHTLASAMAWLKAYGEQEGWDEEVDVLLDDYGNVRRCNRLEMEQHKLLDAYLLDAYLTHNTMDSEEVDAFFEELLGKE